MGRETAGEGEGGGQGVSHVGREHHGGRSGQRTAPATQEPEGAHAEEERGHEGEPGNR